jgi:hypothetical protein
MAIVAIAIAVSLDPDPFINILPIPPYSAWVRTNATIIEAAIVVLMEIRAKTVRITV